MGFTFHFLKLSKLFNYSINSEYWIIIDLKNIILFLKYFRKYFYFSKIYNNNEKIILFLKRFIVLLLC
jgi:hypothetical protein